MKARTRYDHQPDWLDCDQVQSALYDEHGVVCRVECLLRGGHFGAIVRCYSPDKIDRQSVVCQSKHVVNIKSTKAYAVLVFNALYDCYLQMEREKPRQTTEPTLGVAEGASLP